MRSRTLRLFLMGGLLALAGCHHTKPSKAPVELPPLPVIVRPSARPDLERLPTRPTQTREGAEVYKGITEKQVQCQAAAHSSKANNLDEEADQVEEQTTCTIVGLLTHAKRNNESKATLLRYSALEDRNQTAGQALTSYFRILEYEAKADLLRASLHEVTQIVDEFAKLRKQGLKTPADFESLEDKQAEIRRDIVRVENAIATYNDDLGNKLGVQVCGCNFRFWPLTDLVAEEDPPSLEHAVGLAMAKRPAIHASRVLQQQTTRNALPVVRYFLEASAGITGSDPSSQTVLGRLLGIAPLSTRSEHAARRSQIARIGTETEQAVRDEVCRALHDLVQETDLVALARDRMIKQMGKQTKAEERHQSGLIPKAQLLSERLQTNRLEAELVESIANWHIARTKLRQSAGLLIEECPMTPCATAPAHDQMMLPLTPRLATPEFRE